MDAGLNCRCVYVDFLGLQFHSTICRCFWERKTKLHGQKKLFISTVLLEFLQALMFQRSVPNCCCHWKPISGHNKGDLVWFGGVLSNPQQYRSGIPSPSTPYQHLHNGMLNYSLIIRASPTDEDDTHTLAANCHINNLAGSSVEAAQSHSRNLLSASTFCRRVEQQQETLPHLLTWPVVNDLWEHARLLFTTYYKKTKTKEIPRKWWFERFSSCSDLPPRAVLSVPDCIKKNTHTNGALGFPPKCGENDLCISWTQLCWALCESSGRTNNAIIQLYTHAPPPPSPMLHASDFHKADLWRELQ